MIFILEEFVGFDSFPPIQISGATTSQEGANKWVAKNPMMRAFNAIHILKEV